MLIQTTIEGVGEKSIEVKEIPSTPQFKVHFQRRPDYKGEYGFDWFRDYYETKLADKNKLQNLKNEYTPCKINNQDYFVPWLTLMPKSSADLVLKVELNEGVKIKKNAPGKIILPHHSGLIFSPAEIEISDLRSKQEFDVNVKCDSPLAADAKLEVTIDTDNQVVGKLNVLKNKVVSKVNLRFVKVVVYPGTYLNKDENKEYASEEAYLKDVLKKHDIPNFIKTRAFNQALIDVNIDAGDYVIELDGTTLANEGKINGYDIIDDEFAKGLGKDLFARYRDAYELQTKDQSGPEEKHLVVFQTILQRFVLASTIGGESSLTDFSGRSCLIYDAGLERVVDYVHEVGHVLGCLHPFVDADTDRKLEDTLTAWEKNKAKYESEINLRKADIIKYEEQKQDIVNKIPEQEARIRTYNEYVKQGIQVARAKENIIVCQTNIFGFNNSILAIEKELEKIDKHISKLEANIARDKVLNQQCLEFKKQNPYVFDNKSTTLNFMDYSSKRVDFYYWQWLAMQSEIQHYYS